jgi:hypothetical protein
MLRELGVDLIRVASPGRSDRAILHEDRGYFEKSEKLTWRMPVSSFDDYLASLNSKDRSRIKSKLSKSETVSAQWKPLTVSNFKTFYDLYERSVLSKERGRQALDPDWAEKKRSLQPYKLLLYRSGPGGQAIGGAIIKTDPNLLLVTIAYAAYLPEARSHDLGVRTFAEALKHAKANSYQELSHGYDSNLYGHYLSPGLFEFKAGLGFMPRRAGGTEIIRVLNPEAFNNEALFLKGKPSGDISIQLLSDTPRAIVVPKDFELSPHKFVRELRNHIYPSLLTIPLAVRKSGLAPNPLMNDLADLFNELRGESKGPLQGMYGGISNDTPDRMSLLLTKCLDCKGDGSLEHFIEYMNTRDPDPALGDTKELSPQELSFLVRPDSYLRLAASLAKSYPEGFWRDAIGCLAASLALPADLFDRVLINPDKQFLASFFEATLSLCGEQVLSDVFSELNKLTPLASHIVQLDQFEPISTQIPHAVITFDWLGWENLFEPDKAREGLDCLRELREAFIRGQLYEGLLSPSMPDRVFHATIGARATINAVAQARNLAEGKPLDYYKVPMGDYGLMARVLQIQSNLATLVSHNYRRSPISEAEQHFVDLVSYPVHGEYESLITLLMESGIDGSGVRLWGRSVNDTAVDVFRLASNAQLDALLDQIDTQCSYMKDARSKITILRGELLERSEPPQNSHFPNFAVKPALLKEATEHFIKLGFYLLKERRSVVAEYAKFVGLHGIEEISELIRAAAREGKMQMFSQEARFEVIRSALNTPGGARVFIHNLFKFTDGVVATDDLKKALGALPDKGIGLWDLLGLLRGLGTTETRELSLNKIEALDPKSIFLLVSDTDSGWQKAFRSFDYAVTSSEELDDVLLKLQRRITTELQPFEHEDFRIYHNLDTLLGMRESLGLDQRGFWNELNCYAKRNPGGAMRAMSELFKADNEVARKYVSMPEVVELTTTIMRATAPDEFYCTLPDSGSWSQIALPFTKLHQPTPEIANFMNARIRAGHASAQEIGDYIYWVFSHKKLSFSDTNCPPFLSAISNLNYCPEERFSELVTLAAEKLRTVPFDNSKHFSQLRQFIEWLDPIGQRDLMERLIDSSSFLSNHPWEAYGYSRELAEQVRSFCQNQSFTPHRAQLLTSFLMSHNGSSINRFWISRLILSAPVGESDNIVKLMRYWQSLDAETQNKFLSGRVAELLGDIKMRVSAKATGKPFEAIASVVARNEQTGKIDEKASLQLQQLTGYRNLFSSYASARDESKKAQILGDIHEKLIEDYPPKLDPSIEERVLVNHQVALFLEKIDGRSKSQEQIGRFLEEHQVLLSYSGIMDRLVQFFGFADESGRAMLIRLLQNYSDPSCARTVKVSRPDLRGQETYHLDLFGKFDQLGKMLIESGIPFDTSREFIGKWASLWYFGSADARNPQKGFELHFSATHDLERWCKHGEEPVLSCQRISSKCYNMDTKNWNYQFGPNPNAGGRPLARILLPQLKLGEFRVNGELLGRTVLEVTVETRGDVPRLALLVEKTYMRGADRITANYSNFSTHTRQLIQQYADWLGIAPQDVYEADSCPESYPRPLPEQYRIYRDFFRTDK